MSFSSGETTVYIKAVCAERGCVMHTVMTHPFCGYHTDIRSGFYISVSDIAGFGLFSSVSRKKGEFIMFYTGEMVEKGISRHVDYKSQYLCNLNENYDIDAKRTDSGLGRYINSPRGSGLHCNAKYYSDDKRISIFATRDINVDEEILIHYGRDFWVDKL